jgi:hypothetical protein
MRKVMISVTCFLMCINPLFGQNANDVLQFGILVKPGQKIFLRYQDSTLKYDVLNGWHACTEIPDFTTLPDSSIFLIPKSSVNIYLWPMNPLKTSYKTENEIINDPINDEALSALGMIIEQLNSIGSIKLEAVKSDAQELQGLLLAPCGRYRDLIKDIEKIQEPINTDIQSDISGIFTTLQNSSFNEEEATIGDTVLLKARIDTVASYFKKIETLIAKARKSVEDYSCSYPDPFSTRYIFNTILNDYTTLLDEKKKGFDILCGAYQLFKDAVEKALNDAGGIEDLKWSFKLGEIPADGYKMSRYTISVMNSGYNLSGPKNEIIKDESTELLSRTIRIRKFQRFVPEVSVGTAYTFINYNTYGTTSDSANNQQVAEPTVNSLRNLNISAMINFNYYLNNSFIHPLYQLGLGVNSGIPAVLTGLGLRSNINGIKRITISAGIAMTWIKELDTLEPGDKISGTSDIDKDLKYQFTWPPKAYIGIFYNL